MWLLKDCTQRLTRAVALRMSTTKFRRNYRTKRRLNRSPSWGWRPKAEIEHALAAHALENALVHVMRDPRSSRGLPSLHSDLGLPDSSLNHRRRCGPRCAY